MLSLHDGELIIPIDHAFVFAAYIMQQGLVDCWELRCDDGDTAGKEGDLATKSTMHIQCRLH